ncbi:MAG: hypothetical protein ACK54C_15755 [Betaproteobacteria bacterium]
MHEGRAHRVDADDQRDETVFPAFIKARKGAEAPADAHVAVMYRGLWCWIDDRVEPTKAAFSKLMFMLTLTETAGSGTSAPVLKAPAR